MALKIHRKKLNQDDVLSFITEDIESLINLSPDVDLNDLEYLVRYTGSHNYYIYSSLDDIQWNETIRDLVIDYKDDKCILWRKGKWKIANSEDYRYKVSDSSHFDNQCHDIKRSCEDEEDSIHEYYQEYFPDSHHKHQNHSPFHHRRQESIVQVNKLNTESITGGLQTIKIDVQPKVKKQQIHGDTFIVSPPNYVTQPLNYVNDDDLLLKCLGKCSFKYFGKDPWGMFDQGYVYLKNGKHRYLYSREHLNGVKMDNIIQGKFLFKSKKKTQFIFKYVKQANKSWFIERPL